MSSSQADNATVEPMLVIGAGGMLGRAWVEHLRSLGTDFKAIGREELDVTNPAQVQAIDNRYATLVNCSAWTDVDGAETHFEEARELNAEAVDHLAERARHIGAKLVHYSTDYVFRGDADQPYRVDEPRQPINAYGQSKAEGEQRLEQSGADYLLIRTSWLYAPWGKNFVTTMARLMGERDRLRVVNDQNGRPTSAQHLAAATWQLLGQHASGTWHVTDGGQCSWFDLGGAIAEQLEVEADVEPCGSDEFPRPAKRPGYSVLDIDRTEAAIGPMPDWRENLQHVLEATTATFTAQASEARS
jgi:dTDP-4-dehydrorhamnose reductase